VSYAELGSAIPLNGGAYIYLQRTYGPMVGCLFSWTMIFILKPVPVAIVSLIFGDYINRILYFSLNSNETTPIWSQKVLALLCVWTIIGVQVIGVRGVTRINSIFTVIKLAAIGSVAVIGLSMIGRACFKCAKSKRPARTKGISNIIGSRRQLIPQEISHWLSSLDYGLMMVY
jgi:amino acid transporter